MRNTGKLKSDSTLKSSGQLGGGGQLIPLKSLGSRKRLRARSETMQKIYDEERIPFVKDFLARNSQCAFLLPTISDGTEDYSRLGTTRDVTRCRYPAVDVHEIQPRSRGGRLAPIDGDENNYLGLCREHHQWVTSHPKEARHLGYTL